MYCVNSVLCMYCIIVSTLQFAVLMLWLTALTGLTCIFHFEIDNLPSCHYFSSIITKIHTFAISSQIELILIIFSVSSFQC